MAVLARQIRAGTGKIELTELRAALPEAAFDGTPQVHSVIDRSIRQPGKYERVIGFQIVDSDGILIFRSPGAPGTAFPIEQDSGFSDAEIDGVKWRVCIFRDDTLGQIVHIGKQYAIRQEIGGYLLRTMAIPVLLGIVAVGVMIWLSLEWGLKPLSKLAHQVRNRAPYDLSAVEPDSNSTEIRPIFDSLNDLLARLRGTFDTERRFTGDAAHELRTPLAALKVQTQVALRATDAQGRSRALNGILTGVERATHLVNQLLDLSRLDWQQRPEPQDVVDVTELTQQFASDLAAFALDRRVTVTGDGDSGAMIKANETLATMLICNLLDNAIRYSNTRGRVRWSVRRKTRHVLLEITDTGPGIPAEERHAVFERFHRLPVSGGSNGTGLGLSIVGKIVELYDAEISLADSTTGRGLHVSVELNRELTDVAVTDQSRAYLLRLATTFRLAERAGRFGT